MLRAAILVALGLCLGACKVVTSTAGADAGGVSGPLRVSFGTPSTRVSESQSQISVLLVLNQASDVPITVGYDVTGETATQGADFDTFSNLVTFTPGETSQVLYISIIADGIDEPDETLLVEIRSATGGAMFSPTAHVVTIGNNTFPTVNFEMPSSSNLEPFGGTAWLTLTEQTSNFVYVDYTTSGTATSGSDHFLTSGQITFFPGSVREPVNISTIDDSDDENDETIIINLIGATNAMLGGAIGHTHTIRDDDPQPTVNFSISQYVAIEGNDSFPNNRFITVHMSATTVNSVSVPFTVASASSANSADYTIVTPSPLTIPAGATQAQIQISVHGDTVIEGREQLILQLGTPTNATLGFSSIHYFSISNDDCLGTGAFAVCPDAGLTDSVVLPADILTDSNPVCSFTPPLGWFNAGQPDICLVFGRNVTVSSARVRGGRPLVIAALETITVTGTLDASATISEIGAGGFTGSCPIPLVFPGAQAGGAGGTFMTAGGEGGAHNNPATTGGVPGAPLPAPPQLRGGCQGHAGGGATNNAYGLPGGALYLIAGTSITLGSGSIINVSGAGSPATIDVAMGAGGGGSGGMIKLYAPAITATGALLLANGGGGAEGSHSSGSGSIGGNPVATTPLVPAPGGTGNPGGNGGNGFAQGSLASAGASANNNNGAGGGGGGAGYITSNVPLTGAVVSPTPQ